MTFTVLAEVIAGVAIIAYMGWMLYQYQAEEFDVWRYVGNKNTFQGNMFIPEYKPLDTFEHGSRIVRVITVWVNPEIDKRGRIWRKYRVEVVHPKTEDNE